MSSVGAATPCSAKTFVAAASSAARRSSLWGRAMIPEYTLAHSVRKALQYTFHMIVDIDSLRRAVARGEAFRYRFFWGHRPRKDGKISDSCFSQWWGCAFTVDGQR